MSMMPSRGNRKRKSRHDDQQSKNRQNPGKSMRRNFNEPRFNPAPGTCPLSGYIEFNYEMHQQMSEHYNQKDEIRCWVEDCIQQSGYDYSCYIVGSTSNGFGTKNSDVDICLVIDHDTEQVSKSDSMKALKICRKAIRNVGKFNDFAELIPAKVPILRLNIRGVQIDINCNNLTGLRNTWLLNAYSAMGPRVIDPRVRPVAMFLKKICKKLTINDASEGTLTSYSINLMLINYLQTRTPPILPVLQGLDEEINISDSLHELPHRIRRHPAEWEVQNTATVGQLVFGFFDYYNQFDFNQVISVRLGKPVSALDERLMFPDNQLFTGKKIRIEEPFDGTNTARAVYKPESFPKIKFAIQTAQRLFEKCLDGGIDVQEVVNDLYLDKEELELYSEHTYAGSLGLNYTGVQFGKRRKVARKPAEHNIFVISSSDSSEDEGNRKNDSSEDKNASAKREGTEKETEKDRKEKEREVEVTNDHRPSETSDTRGEESNGTIGSATRDHKEFVSDEGVGTYTGDTVTVESDEEYDFEIVEEKSTSAVLDEKKQKMKKILEILKQKADAMSSDDSSDENPNHESEDDDSGDDCVITSAYTPPVATKETLEGKTAKEIECILLESDDDDDEKPSTSEIKFPPSKLSLPPPKSS